MGFEGSKRWATHPSGSGTSSCDASGALANALRPRGMTRVRS